VFLAFFSGFSGQLDFLSEIKFYICNMYVYTTAFDNVRGSASQIVFIGRTLLIYVSGTVVNYHGTCSMKLASEALTCVTAAPLSYTT